MAQMINYATPETIGLRVHTGMDAYSPVVRGVAQGIYPAGANVGVLKIPKGCIPTKLLVQIKGASAGSPTLNVGYWLGYPNGGASPSDGAIAAGVVASAVGDFVYLMGQATSGTDAPKLVMDEEYIFFQVMGAATDVNFNATFTLFADYAWPNAGATVVPDYRNEV